MRKEIIEFNKNLRGKTKIDFKAGDVVKVNLKIKEGGKERVQVFEGLVISVGGRQSSSPKITIRKVSHGVGVEIILPLLSKNIEKIELVKRAKVRRAKLYYVRNLSAKQSRMKYEDIADYIKKEEKTVEAEEKTEEKVEAEKKETTEEKSK